MDNSDMIAELLADMQPPNVTGNGGAGAGGRGGMSGGGAGMSGGANTDAGSTAGTPARSDDDGCTAASPIATRARACELLLLLLALGSIVRRRRVR
jgi:hypothetical protein